MPSSIFTEKNKKPEHEDLKKVLGKSYTFWEDIKEYILSKYPDGSEEWAYPGSSFGWNFRIKGKKRVIAYFMPQDKYFMVSFVFGAVAADEIMKSKIAPEIKHLISSAKVYAEGRGIRIEVKSRAVLKDIKRLVDIKLLH